MKYKPTGFFFNNIYKLHINEDCDFLLRDHNGVCAFFSKLTEI